MLKKPKAKLSDLNFGPRPQDRASEAVISHFKHQLFEGTLKPGDFLGSEVTMVEQFRVGRRSVREAIQALQGLGLIEVRAGAKGGAWVSEGHPDRFAEALALQFKLAHVPLKHIFEMQHVLECTAARLAAERRTDVNLDELKSIVREGAEVIGSQRAFQENGLNFHICVAKSSQNPVMPSLFRALRLVTRRDALSLTVPVRKQIQVCHEKIYRLIELREADEAADLMGRHVDALSTGVAKIKPRFSKPGAAPGRGKVPTPLATKDGQ